MPDIWGLQIFNIYILQFLTEQWLLDHLAASIHPSLHLSRLRYQQSQHQIVDLTRYDNKDVLFRIEPKAK